jgi:hypothetical protein
MQAEVTAIRTRYMMGVVDPAAMPESAEIAVCFADSTEDRKAGREHERERERVGNLGRGMRIAWQQPGQLRRAGTVAARPLRHLYHVLPDDGRGDWHLAGQLCAVLWASHEVEILGKGGEVVSRPKGKGKGKAHDRLPPNHKLPMEYWADWCGRVTEVVETRGCSAAKAVRAVNEERGTGHADVSYHKYMREVDGVDRVDEVNRVNTGANR